jgi:hypothetical protein
MVGGKASDFPDRGINRGGSGGGTNPLGIPTNTGGWSGQNSPLGGTGNNSNVDVVSPQGLRSILDK